MQIFIKCHIKSHELLFIIGLCLCTFREGKDSHLSSILQLMIPADCGHHAGQVHLHTHVSMDNQQADWQCIMHHAGLVHMHTRRLTMRLIYQCLMALIQKVSFQAHTCQHGQQARQVNINTVISRESRIFFENL